MRILKNNLYIQEKNKKKLFKNPLVSLFENYKNIINEQINLENNNKLLPQLIYNQHTTKKTRKLKKIAFVALLNILLKKLIFYSISYKKLSKLIELWILNTYSKYLNYLNKSKISNNKLIFFYIKKKCNLIFSIIEKIKFNYLHQFLIIFFKTNKKLKYILDNQLNLTLLKNKNINALTQKIKTVLHNNQTIQLQNKHFFNEYLMLLKTVKKELILDFFDFEKTSIKQVKKIRSIDSNFFNLFIKKKYNISFTQFKQTVTKHNFTKINQIDEYYTNKKNPLFKLDIQKKETNDIALKWIFFNQATKQTNNLIAKYIYKLITQKKIKNQITSLKEKNVIYLQKEKNTNFILQHNIFSHLLNNKNTKHVFYSYNKNLHFIVTTLENKNNWFTGIINQTTKFFNTDKDNLKKRKQKKNINSIYNTTIFTLNKKHGITYNCMLLNDNLAYWTKDYNINEEIKKNHLQSITELQKNTYKILIVKYMNSTTNIISTNNNKLQNYLNYLNNQINNNNETTYIGKQTLIRFNM